MKKKAKRENRTYVKTYLDKDTIQKFKAKAASKKMHMSELLRTYINKMI